MTIFNIYRKRHNLIAKYGKRLADEYDAFLYYIQKAHNNCIMCYPYFFECDKMIEMLQEEGYNVEKWDKLSESFYESCPHVVPILVTW